MFSSTLPSPLADTDVTVPVPSEVVPLSVLALDLGEPATGWASHLADRDIEIVLDDLGRACIARSDAKQLFDEQREDELRRQEAAARNEARAVEQDRLRRAQIWGGIPAIDLPYGVSASTAMLAADKAAQPRRQSVLQEALSGESLTYHSYQTSSEDAA